LQHKIKQNHKNISIRLKYQKYMKFLRLMKTVALKSPRLVKSLRQKNCRAYQNLCAYQKLGGKDLRLLTIWARQNLQLLTSSKSG
jgi:hypothetical protein